MSFLFQTPSDDTKQFSDPHETRFLLFLLNPVIKPPKIGLYLFVILLRPESERVHNEIVLLLFWFFMFFSSGPWNKFDKFDFFFFFFSFFFLRSINEVLHEDNNSIYQEWSYCHNYFIKRRNIKLTSLQPYRQQCVYIYSYSWARKFTYTGKKHILLEFSQLYSFLSGVKYIH